MPIQWLSVKEAAEALGVSPATVRRRANRNMLPSRRDAANRLSVGIPMQGDVADAPTVAADSSEAPPSEMHCSSVPAERSGERSADQPSRQPAFTAAVRPADHAAPATLGPELAKPFARLHPGSLINPARHNGQANHESADDRFQRLAGASLVLAQRQADEARENLGRMNAELRRLHRLCTAGWSAAVGVALLSILILITT